MKKNPNNKKVIEEGTYTLAQIMINEENANKLIKAGIVDMMVATTKTHPDWRKFALSAINLLDSLTMMESTIPNLKNAGGIEAVVSILSGKTYFIEKLEADRLQSMQTETDEKDMIKENEKCFSKKKTMIFNFFFNKVYT